MSSECKRIEEGYKKAMNVVQQNFSAYDDKFAAKVKKLENQYTEKREQMRLQYKDKC